MVIGGKTPPPSGSSSDDHGAGDDSEDDSLPLSAVFVARQSGERRSRGPSAAKKPREVGGKPRPHRAFGIPYDGSRPKSRGNFATGDLVWAKAFPYTWCPGWLRGSRGALRLVAFFGCDRALWLDEATSICEFEENYPSIARMCGARLAQAVDSALLELGRRVGLGMACGCRGVAGVGGGGLTSQIVGERRRFDPAEMLGFVRRLGVHAWVDEEETTSAVRVGAQMNAFRSHVSLGTAAERIGEFQPEELLKRIRSLAVLGWVADKREMVETVLAHVDACRHFVSADKNGVDPSTAEKKDIYPNMSDSDDSEGNDLEMSFICLSETEEAAHSGFLYENDMDEQSEKGCTIQGETQADGEFCTLNRIDYSIFTSDLESECLSELEFEHLYESRMENDHKQNEERGMTDDSVRRDEISTFDETTYNQTSDLIDNSIPTVSGDVETSETYRVNGFDTDNEALEKVVLLSINDLRNSSVSIDLMHGKSVVHKSSCRCLSCLGNFDGKECNETYKRVTLITPVEMHKTSVFSSTDGSVTSSPEHKTDSSSQFFVSTSPSYQQSVESEMLYYEKSGFQVLCGMVHHLHCLASDPLNVKSGRQLPLLQLLLNYRASTFQNVHSHPSGTCSEEVAMTLESDAWCSHDGHQDKKTVDICERPNVTECSSNIQAAFQAHDNVVKLQHNTECHSDLHMIHATVNNFSSHPDNDKIAVNETIVEEYDKKINHRSSFEIRHSGKIVHDKRYAATCDDVGKESPGGVSTWKRMFNQKGTPTSNGCVMSDEIRDSFQGDVGCEAATIQSNNNFSVTPDKCEKDTETKAASSSSSVPLPSCGYQSSSGRKKRLDKPVDSHVLEWQEGRYYASPLVRDSASATYSRQCSKIGKSTGTSNSLHMKFPRGVDLPSKEDLVKIFSVFGPVDHSRTKIFFYTGAGKVVFLKPSDAETAYNCVRRNGLFQTGMRFWLDAHESLRKDYRTTLISPRGQMPEVKLKSCLKRTSVHENEGNQKKCKVRFVT